jgi:hypothetical protein
MVALENKEVKLSENIKPNNSTQVEVAANLN